jgi:nucleoid DNA-binding protein
MAKKHTAKSGKATATKSKATAAKTTHKGGGIGGAKAGKSGKPMTKAMIYTAISDHLQLPKKKVGEVFDALTKLIERELKAKDDVFTLPGGMIKIKIREKGPTPERKGRNPRTGQETIIAAKPKHNVIKVYAMKPLRALVQK